jgi:hypothetical protein
LDEFQATPPEELPALRRRSAVLFADRLLTDAIALLAARDDTALEELRRRASAYLRETPDYEGMNDREARIAVEELERVIQIATGGSSELKGWTQDGAPTIEEEGRWDGRG